MEQANAEFRAGHHLAAITSYDAAVTAADSGGDADLLARAALGYEDVSWRPGRHGAAATVRLTRALARLDPQATAQRVELLGALTRSAAMHGDAAGSQAAFAEAQALIARLDDPLLEAKVLAARHGAYLDDAAGYAELATETDAATARLRELCDRIDDVDTEILGRQIRLRALARLGRMPQFRAELEQMAEVIVGLRSPFWHYVLSHLDAMLQLHDGRLADAEDASIRCLQAGQRLVGEDNSGLDGLRMFVIRREQDRLAPLAPFVRQLVRSEPDGSIWLPGLMLMLAEIGETAEAARLLAEVRRGGFAVPSDAMWSTVMALLVEAAAVLGDRASAGLLADHLAAQSAPRSSRGTGSSASDRPIAISACSRSWSATRSSPSGTSRSRRPPTPPTGRCCGPRTTGACSRTPGSGRATRRTPHACARWSSG